MKSGDFVLVDFVGRVKDTREIFDLTLADVAKKENVYDEKISYKPIVAIIGGGLTIKGLDEAIEGMNIGEKKTVEISPDKGFGERKLEYIKLIPMSNFIEQHIDPEPGSYVKINNVNGKVVSIDGGRIKVDFNHPLAGKKLEYEIEIKSQISDVNDKIKSVIDYFTGINKEDIDISIADKTAEITFKKKVDLHASSKQTIAGILLKWVGEIEKLKFSDVYSK